ncbi:MAG: shikimate dehydrogenase [Pseudohongiellaceae bacterium]
MTRYAVVGNPADHSKSPEIHARFAAQTTEDVDYSAVTLEPESFERWVSEFFAAGGGGLNVTVPFKERAFALCEERSPRAQRAGAVNTLYLDATGRLSGDNTDGVGLLRDIVINNNFPVAERKVLVLGAGGAVRGVLAVLVDALPAEIKIANRTLARAHALSREFHSLFPVSVAAYDELHQQFDLIINGTSASLNGQVPPLPDTVIARGCCCYDMMYSDRDTPFVEWARNHDAALILDGIGMLVEQAAESFAIWRGKRPDTAPVIEALRKHGVGGE